MDVEERKDARLNPDPEDVFPGIIGHSPAWKRMRDDIEAAARSEFNVMILGETGTGKELAARAIHLNSRRRSRAFVPFSCPAAPGGLEESIILGHVRGAFTGAVRDAPGLIEQAHRGTLFLDELGDMAPSLQAKLLRVVDDRVVCRVGGEQSRQFDVRFVSATNHDIHQAIADRRFRQELFYRLAEVIVVLPPLRDREDDCLIIADNILPHYCELAQKPFLLLSEAARRRLLEYEYPGNIRELQVILKASAVFETGPEISLATVERGIEQASLARDSPEQIAWPLPDDLPGVERILVRRALRMHNGNLSRAAELLKIPRGKLLGLILQLGILFQPNPRGRPKSDPPESTPE